MVHLALLILTRIPHIATSRQANYFAALVCIAMRGLAYTLALATTAGIAVYDGKSSIFAFDEEFSRAESYRRSMTRFLVWHYAPLAAWTALQVRIDATGVHVGPRTRWIAWSAIVTIAVGVYAIIVSTGEGIPSDYPVTSTSAMVVAAIALVGIPFLLAA